MIKMRVSFLLVCLMGVSLARKLPSFVEVCKPKHTDVNECLKRNVEKLKPRIKEGIPELLIPSFDPFVLPSADFQLSDTFFVNVKNLKIYLKDSFNLDYLDADLDKATIHLKVSIPRINVVTEYGVKGKLLVLNLNGQGTGYLNLTDVYADVTTQGYKEKRNGKEYLVLDNLDIKPKIKKMSIDLQNLFPNNEELTASANKLFNENQDVLLEDFTPVVLKIVKQFITTYVKRFLDNFSFDVLFPDN